MCWNGGYLLLNHMDDMEITSSGHRSCYSKLYINLWKEWENKRDIHEVQKWRQFHVYLNCEWQIWLMSKNNVSRWMDDLTSRWSHPRMKCPVHLHKHTSTDTVCVCAFVFVYVNRAFHPHVVHYQGLLGKFQLPGMPTNQSKWPKILLFPKESESIFLDQFQVDMQFFFILNLSLTKSAYTITSSLSKSGKCPIPGTFSVKFCSLIIYHRTRLPLMRCRINESIEIMNKKAKLATEEEDNQLYNER